MEQVFANMSNKVAEMDVRKHLKGEINYHCEREGSLLRASGGSLKSARRLKVQSIEYFMESSNRNVDLEIESLINHSMRVGGVRTLEIIVQFAQPAVQRAP
jgi:hypothetical protein